MGSYHYKAMNPDGEAVEGTIESESAYQATAVLRERGLDVRTVEELVAEGAVQGAPSALSWDDLSLFVMQLQGLTRAGLPLPQGLAALAHDLGRPRLRDALERCRLELERGASLEEALERQGNVFPPVFVRLVQAGESSGDLPGVLRLLAQYTRRTVSLRDQWRTAMAYPTMLALVGVGVILFLLLVVMPALSSAVFEIGARLPPLAAAMHALSRFVSEYGAVLLGLLVVVGLLRVAVPRLIRRTHAGRQWLDWLRLYTPLTGRLHYLLNLALFARTLALLLTARLAILEALESAAAATGSPMLERAVGDAAGRIAAGETVSAALASTEFFPPHFCWLLGTHETRGQLEVALDAAADGFEREAGLRDRVLTGMLTPAAVILVGVVVAVFFLAIYMPLVYGGGLAATVGNL